MECAATLSVATTAFVTRFLKLTVMAWSVGLYATKELLPPASLNAPYAGVSATIDASTCPSRELVYAQYLAIVLGPKNWKVCSRAIRVSAAVSPVPLIPWPLVAIRACQLAMKVSNGLWKLGFPPAPVSSRYCFHVAWSQSWFLPT